MEPLVCTIVCPHCREAMVEFAHTAESGCEACGFQIAIYNDKKLAARHYTQHRRDEDVIVADPVRLARKRWVLAHTRLFLA